MLFDGLPNAPPLKKGERVSAFMGMIEIPNKIRKAFNPGLALVGDAALAIDPLWGVSCGWAFQSAEWLAEAVGNSFQRPDNLDRGLDLWSAA
jgi:flavin-dependent dehydrogenase